MQPDVTPFFTIATTSSGLPNIAIRFWKEHCASGYEPSFGRSAGTGGTDRLGRFVQRACPHVRRDTTAYRGGVAISGRGATSAPPAATSQTRRYFSISSIMNLPASAGSYSVHKRRAFPRAPAAARFRPRHARQAFVRLRLQLGKISPGSLARCFSRSWARLPAANRAPITPARKTF